MSDRADTPRDLSPTVVTGPHSLEALRAVLETVGATLHGAELRSVHQRGTTSVSAVHRVQLTDGDGVRRDRLFVTHASTRAVPDGAAHVRVDDTVLHIWQFPHDPYLPGLRPAVSRVEAAATLRRHGVTDPGTVAIHTRSYRPTRRAVVELTPETATTPAAFVKLLGGRDEGRRRQRTERLVTVHQRLHGHDLPVPAVLEHDTTVGTAVLAALPGRTLRTVLRDGDAVPDPSAVADLLHRLHAVPALPTGADPDGFADPARHVAVLTEQLPEHAATLDRLAAVATSVGGPLGTLHGDLHDGQVLVDDGAVSGLLDLDGAGTGHVAHDVGRLLAHVEAIALTTPAAADRAAAYATDLHAAMAGLAPPGDVASAATSAWIALATGPLRVAAASWRTDALARLAEAERWAALAT